MRMAMGLLAALLVGGAATNAFAVEGNSAAGPIGGTDARAAQLPPPGLYGGLITLHAAARRFTDGAGNPVAALDGLDLKRNWIAPFLLYVPGQQVLGGSLGFAAVLPTGNECGTLFANAASACTAGLGDPYVEAQWSRFFGTMRPSRFAGALPIPEGLTLALGVGAVVPVGTYDMTDATTRGLTLGNNLWDVAPFAAVTYVTPPLIADGTEFSAKFYWNNYRENPDTHYKTGALLDVDFAVTERIGRLQAGFAGFYSWQVADDMRDSQPVAPDGMRMQFMEIGGVAIVDLPEYATSFKIKVLTAVVSRNTVKASEGVAISVFHKFQ